MTNKYRVLAIPLGEDDDSEGRKLGDDWLIADFGVAELDELSYHIYVTTDRVRASERSGNALGDANLYVVLYNSLGSEETIE